MKKRRLIILRHAKSSWDSDAADDHSRPLNKRGRRDAPRMGEHLRRRGWLPTTVISSDSRRTRETVKGLFSDVDLEPEVVFTRSLYHAGLNEIREAIAEHGDDATEILVVGHNPGWEDAVATLSGAHHRFTTCNAALFEVEAESWDEAFESGDWHLDALLKPRDLADDGD